MKSSPMLFRLAAVGFALLATPLANAVAENAVAETKPVPRLGKPASTVYRHSMPDGRIVYADKIIPSGTVEETITIAPRIEGNEWAAGSGKRRDIPPQVNNTQVTRVPSIPDADRTRSKSDVRSDVIKAEMLLEDAKKQKEEGVEPLPGERTGTVSGTSRLNEEYWERQEALQRQVEEATEMLENARSELSALQPVR